MGPDVRAAGEGGREAEDSFGIFRSVEDSFPFRNTAEFDVQEAYLSGMIPIGKGMDTFSISRYYSFF